MQHWSRRQWRLGVFCICSGSPLHRLGDAPEKFNLLLGWSLFLQRIVALWPRKKVMKCSSSSWIYSNHHLFAYTKMSVVNHNMESSMQLCFDILIFLDFESESKGRRMHKASRLWNLVFYSLFPSFRISVGIHGWKLQLVTAFEKIGWISWILLIFLHIMSILVTILELAQFAFVFPRPEEPEIYII